jgi:hypothetical protein
VYTEVFADWSWQWIHRSTDEATGRANELSVFAATGVDAVRASA